MSHASTPTTSVMSLRFPFFFSHPTPTSIYPLSLHDALPIYRELIDDRVRRLGGDDPGFRDPDVAAVLDALLGVADRRPLHRTLRSEEHTSELQSQSNLVCRLLLEKKNWLPLLRTSFATQ